MASWDDGSGTDDFVEFRERCRERMIEKGYRLPSPSAGPEAALEVPVRDNATGETVFRSVRIRDICQSCLVARAMFGPYPCDPPFICNACVKRNDPYHLLNEARVRIERERVDEHRQMNDALAGDTEALGRLRLVEDFDA